MNTRSLDGLAVFIKRRLDFVDDEAGHLTVDLRRQFNQPRLVAGLLRFPGEIDGVDRNAVTAQPGAGIKRHEAEGLAGGSLDDFPDINAHVIAHQRHLVSPIRY